MMIGRTMKLAVAAGCVCAVASAVAGMEDFCTEADCRAVRVEKGALQPFAEQMALRILPGSFRDSKGRDFVAEGGPYFGGKKVLHRYLRMEKGVPVYSPGEPFPEGPSPEKTDERRGRGLCDIDGDGIKDLLTVDISAHGASGGYPWAGGSPWNDKPSLYSGVARGYDIMGRWLGYESVGEVYWSKGTKGTDGRGSFGPKRNVLLETPGFERIKDLKRALVWKVVHGIGGVCVLETKAGRWLVLQGDVNALVALPLSFRNGEAYCGEARPLLKDGFRMPHGYITYGLYPVDLDLDGQDEILCGGNPGVVVSFRGDEPGNFTSAPVLLEGGDVCVETIATQSHFDWDGDGRRDLILSDSTGWLTFWGGTDDPLVYRAPRPFTRDGKPWIDRPGDNWSLQGFVERCWGYLKPTAGKWNGRNVILTVDVRGEMFLRVPEKGNMLELHDKQFTLPDGTPYLVAWRCKADFIRAKTGFAEIPWDSFLVQDLDGDAAVAIPRKEWSLTIGRTVKLTYADGRPVRLCGINGLWGRAHFAFVDWDGDGKHDFIYGSDRACQRFFRPDLPGGAAQPFLFRNVGTNAKPLFAKGVPFRLKKNGKRLNFVSHEVTSSVTDWTGDGKPDLMVGAENGKVYAFEHDELFVKDE